ncbi:NUDIX hydrolase [Nonomuraea sp. NPDC004702]
MGAESELTRWIVHGERLVYDNRWIRLGLADIEIPGGQRFEHHVVHLDRAAITVVLDEEDRALLIWRHRFVADRWGWELPGGLVEAGEDPMDTAVREVEEETGYRPKNVEPLVSYQPMAGMVDAEHLLFVARGAEWMGAPEGEVEADRIQWVPIAEVRSMMARGEIWTSGTLIGLLQVQMWLNGRGALPDSI